jgi:hypothetical protein
MHVDRARYGDAVDGQFLFVDAIGRETGEQSPDQRNKPNDETQPNHSLTQKKEELAWDAEQAFDIRRGSNEPKLE